MKSKARLAWPRRGEGRRLVTKNEVCIHGNFSHNHFDRLAGKPAAIRIGLRAKRWWSDEWDQYFETLPRVAAE